MKKLVLIILIFLLFYTRFVNLGWGLPYPMHPDERNMAVAVQQLSCPPLSELIASHYPLATCLNPHFFAYGQLPLYLAYGGVQLYHGIFSLSGQPTFEEATLALRTLSALSSILLVFILMKIIVFVLKLNNRPSDLQTFRLLTLLFFIFQPYAIQFAHFGTTESLLMLFYALIIYYSLNLVTSHQSLAALFLLGLFSGLALGTKTSSILFLGVPIIAIFIHKLMEGGKKRGIYHRFIPLFISLFSYFFISLLFFILSSPQSLLNWTDFMSSMNYESAIGLGTYVPFYTRQFVGTIPILFQFTNILPYVLGWPQLILSILGFLFLPSYLLNMFLILVLQVARVKGTRQHAKKFVQQESKLFEYWRGKLRVTESAIVFDLFRLSLLISFLPPSLFFAKWTRFIAPSLPLFSLFALLFLLQYAKKNVKVIAVIIFIAVIPGFSFLSIYTSPDVRFTASEWIYKNIPANSKILTETANVIDLPIPTSHYSLDTSHYLVNSFNFYDLDADQNLKIALSEALKEVDYIIVPSRRVFKNHTCLSPESRVQSLESKKCAFLTTNYQLLSTYYTNLFSGASGFELVKEFSSYPQIKFQILSFKFQIPFPDENAEETWTVFDHPVIRIYKKITNLKSQISNQSQITNFKIDFSNYQTAIYQIPTSPYSLATSHSLLVADTPSKWEKGLMYVKNRGDIGDLDGMMFSFPDSQKRMFWNKNTLSPLTLYWINEGKVIGTSDLKSITETNGVVTTYTSPSEADTVIEIIK